MKTSKKFDYIFTGIIFAVILGFAFYISGLSGVIDVIIIFIKETFKILIIFIIVVILCILFSRIYFLLNKTNKK